MIVTTLLGYFLLLIFFYMERRLRNGPDARSLAEGPYDRGTTRFLATAYFASILALLASWALNAIGLATLTHWVGWLGVVIAFIGLLTRAWANRILGEYYTRTLKVVEGQPIIRRGLYRVIRHPGYLGMILMWIGASIATCNWMVMVVVIVAIVFAYHHRIENEERMLTGTLPEYDKYRSQTWRLIPFIY